MNHFRISQLDYYEGQRTDYSPINQSCFLLPGSARSGIVTSRGKYQLFMEQSCISVIYCICSGSIRYHLPTIYHNIIYQPYRLYMPLGKMGCFLVICHPISDEWPWPRTDSGDTVPPTWLAGSKLFASAGCPGGTPGVVGGGSQSSRSWTQRL